MACCSFSGTGSLISASFYRSSLTQHTYLKRIQFRVLRQQGTEWAFTGKFDKHFATGVYTCAGCNTPLYKSDTKFKSGCGWPAYFDSIPGAVGRRDDFGGGMVRTEIFCNACGGHLGHVFKGEGLGVPSELYHSLQLGSLCLTQSISRRETLCKLDFIEL
jgi:peptide-methionine (R)-S-oxide reductase